VTGPAFVVYTDMVADLFHAGHVEFLRKARAAGEARAGSAPVHLVVGVVSDDDVASYKRRPVMSTHERAVVLAECRLVDEVIEGPPVPVTAEFLAEIGAGLVVHGDDMDADELRHWYGAAMDLGLFATVAYTREVDGVPISTTEVLRRARDGGA
jgi:cytidyltransferase-like protein